MFAHPVTGPAGLRNPEAPPAIGAAQQAGPVSAPARGAPSPRLSGRAGGDGSAPSPAASPTMGASSRVA